MLKTRQSRQLKDLTQIVPLDEKMKDGNEMLQTLERVLLY